MTELFIIEGFVVMPHPTTLLLPHFKQIWERDKTPKKNRAMQEFAFIEFYLSPRKSNPFVDYSDKEIRKVKIIEAIFKGDKYVPDQEVVNAILFYKKTIEEESFFYKFLEDSIAGAEKLSAFYKGIDFTKVNTRTGKPVYSPKEVGDALKTTFDIITSLHNTREKVNQELFSKTKTKADKRTNVFEE